MTEDESYTMKFIRGTIIYTFTEMSRIDRINNHERIVSLFVDRAARILINKYWNEDNWQRLSDYLDIKYDKKLKASTVEWTRYFEKWEYMRKEVIDEVPYEKRRQWMDKIDSFQETDLIKKIKGRVFSEFDHPLYKEFEKMFLVQFDEIKQYLMPLVSQLDFSWCEKYVNEIVGDL